MLVCHCVVVNDRRVREVVAEGAQDLLDVAAACGAGSYCGGCQPTLATLLSEETGRPASDFRAPTPASPARVEPGRRHFASVVRAIEEEVLEAGWHGGDDLGTRDALASRYGCTRGTLDRAVWVLEQHGIVTYDPARALHVGVPDATAIAEAAALHLRASGVELAQLVRARRRIEGAIARLAAHQPDLTARRGLRRWAEGSARGDPEAEAVDFHRLLGEAAANPVLQILSDCLIHVARLLVGAVGSAWGAAGHGVLDRLAEQVAEEHRRLAEAVLAGDGTLAERLMSEHVEGFYRRIADIDPGRAHVSAPVTDAGSSPSSVAQAAAQDIRDRAVAPGELVGDGQQLLRRYGTDRDVLRHAATLLEYYGVAHERPGRRGGLVVLSPDPWPAAQLLAMYLDHEEVTAAQVFEVRAPVEHAAAMAAATNADERAVTLLRQRRQEEREAWSADRGAVAGRWGHHDVHVVLGEIAGDPVLRLIVAALELTSVRGARRWGTGTRPAGVRERLARDHDELVEAVAAGDAARAGTVAAAHLERIRRAISSSAVAPGMTPRGRTERADADSD